MVCPSVLIQGIYSRYTTLPLPSQEQNELSVTLTVYGKVLIPQVVHFAPASKHFSLTASTASACPPMTIVLVCCSLEGTTRASTSVELRQMSSILIIRPKRPPFSLRLLQPLLAYIGRV